MSTSRLFCIQPVVASTARASACQFLLIFYGFLEGSFFVQCLLGFQYRFHGFRKSIPGGFLQVKLYYFTIRCIVRFASHHANSSILGLVIFPDSRLNIPNPRWGLFAAVLQDALDLVDGCVQNIIIM